MKEITKITLQDSVKSLKETIKLIEADVQPVRYGTQDELDQQMQGKPNPQSQPPNSYRSTVPPGSIGPRSALQQDKLWNQVNPNSPKDVSRPNYEWTRPPNTPPPKDKNEIRVKPGDAFSYDYFDNPHFSQDSATKSPAEVMNPRRDWPREIIRTPNGPRQITLSPFDKVAENIQENKMKKHNEQTLFESINSLNSLIQEYGAPDNFVLPADKPEASNKYVTPSEPPAPIVSPSTPVQNGPVTPDKYVTPPETPAPIVSPSTPVQTGTPPQSGAVIGIDGSDETGAGAKPTTDASNIWNDAIQQIITGTGMSSEDAYAALSMELDNPNADPSPNEVVKRVLAAHPAPTAAVPAANKTSHNWKEIYDLNKQVIGKNPNKIYPGQQLKMPNGSTYIVKPGDSLWKISKMQQPTPPAAPPTMPGVGHVSESTNHVSFGNEDSLARILQLVKW
jgi:LysM repeat protein